MTQHQSCESNPIAYVSIGRNRSKIYGDAVYVRDGQEFQLELFNPTNGTIGAKVYLNGKAISDSLIVLRPGERSWLERYLDDNKKFAFNTYNVENSEAAKKAIQENGKIRVEFFRERTQNYTPTVTWNTGTGLWPNQQWPYGTVTCASGISGASGSLGLTGSAGSFSTAGSNSTYTANTASFSCSVGDGALTRSAIADSVPIETGRVEKGGSSDQSFGNYYGNFESWYFTQIEYRLMPESQRPVEMKNIRQYCSGCGVRIRKASWKFCPSCGAKMD